MNNLVLGITNFSGPYGNSSPNKIATKSNANRNKYASENSVRVLDLCIAHLKKIHGGGNSLVSVESTSQPKEILESNFERKENWESQISSQSNKLKNPRNC